MDSIIQNQKECFICKNQNNLNCHHCFAGSANRKISEQNGFKVWLCVEHHLGDFGVHGTYGHNLDLFLKQLCQSKFEESKSRSEFMSLIGRNYL